MNQKAQTQANKSSSFAALKFLQYRWLFAGNIAFSFAMQGQIIARSILAWELTRSELALAQINLAVAIPMLLGSLVGGAIADRTEKRKLLVIGQLFVALNEGVILYLLLTEQLQFWNLVVAAVFMGSTFPFIMPSRIALSVKVVGKDNIGNAMALAVMILNLARVLGPVCAGLLIGVVELEGVYALAILLYLIGTACMFGVKPAPPEKGADSKPLLADVKYGFTYLGQNRQILLLLLFGLLPMLLAMPFQNLLVVFADEVWEVGARGLGFLQGAAGIGGVLGALWVARRGETPQRFKVMVRCTLGFGVFLAIFCFVPSFYWALIPLILANIFANVASTINNTSIQILVPDEVRGRITSFMLMSFGLMPLGVLPMAYAAEHIGAPAAVAVASVILIVGVIIFVLSSPTFRRLDGHLESSLAD
ncbi:MAG: MFS transporter [Candidatus Lindowbacteria bacterium]|nr:MFS transporter [Candidatus Lindowbacteria bacterium]